MNTLYKAFEKGIFPARRKRFLTTRGDRGKRMAIITNGISRTA